MTTDRIEMKRIEPGVIVWADRDNPGTFYITVTRGNYRSTRQLEATTLDAAVIEAKENLK